MQILYLISAAIGILFLVCYAYQLAYIPAVWIGRRQAEKNAGRTPETGGTRSAAALICARNEETVIRD
ncbi:MAG: hypothetical protein IJH73_07960, partial [Lachnospiraceae bacterium]|nr:hypothetical protein [Lachnospiraceae bacterium]